MINYVVSKCLGPNFFDIVVKELKKFVKKISNKFSNKLKKILNEKYSAQIKQMIIFDTIDQNSSWGKYLSTQLKIALKCLSRILNLFVKTILNLLKSLIKEDTWEKKLKDIFINFSECGIDILKTSLEESLENAQLTFLEVFKNFAQKNIKNFSNAIFTIDDYLNKALQLPEKSKDLMNILVDNQIINWDGEINFKLINDNPFYNPKYNFKFPMNEIRSGLNKVKNCHDKILNLSQIHLKQFENRKIEIINKLKEINQKIEEINIDKKQDIVIEELEICLGNEVLDIFFEALNNVEIVKFLKENIKNAQEIISTAKNSVQGI